MTTSSGIPTVAEATEAIWSVVRHESGNDVQGKLSALRAAVREEQRQELEHARKKWEDCENFCIELMRKLTPEDRYSLVMAIGRPDWEHEKVPLDEQVKRLRAQQIDATWAEMRAKRSEDLAKSMAGAALVDLEFARQEIAELQKEIACLKS